MAEPTASTRLASKVMPRFTGFGKEDVPVWFAFTCMLSTPDRHSCP